MFPKEHKRSAASLHEKLQLLRSITHSHALNETSIIQDASKYIEELKEKVERLNQDITSSQNHTLSPKITVEILEKGYMINISLDKSCPGLLVYVLEAFEELNLNVVEARASCADNFTLEAISGEGDEQGEDSTNPQIVRQAIFQAIRNWSLSNDNQDS